MYESPIKLIVQDTLTQMKQTQEAKPIITKIQAKLREIEGSNI